VERKAHNLQPIVNCVFCAGLVQKDTSLKLDQVVVNCQINQR